MGKVVDHNPMRDVTEYQSNPVHPDPCFCQSLLAEVKVTGKTSALCRGVMSTSGLPPPMATQTEPTIIRRWVSKRGLASVPS